MFHRILMLLLCLSALYGCQPTKEDYRNDYVKGCVNRYASDSTLASEAGRKLVEQYCNCEGDMLNAQMDAAQWREMNKGAQELLNKYLIKAQPCRDDFSAKLLNLTGEQPE